MARQRARLQVARVVDARALRAARHAAAVGRIIIRSAPRLAHPPRELRAVGGRVALVVLRPDVRAWRAPPPRAAGRPRAGIGSSARCPFGISATSA